jgi:hypothetical protein
MPTNENADRVPHTNARWWLTRDKLRDPEGDCGMNTMWDSYCVWVGDTPVLKGERWTDDDRSDPSSSFCPRLWEALYPHLRLQPGECIRIRPIQIERWEETT